MGNELSTPEQTEDKRKSLLNYVQSLQDKHVVEAEKELLTTELEFSELEKESKRLISIISNLKLKIFQKQSMIVGKAILFAAEKHKFQRRKADDSAYINHPLRVMQILIDFNLVNFETLCAAVLHDTVEDTDATIEEIKENFGEEIAGYVEEVTDDKSLSKLEIKKRQIENAKHKSLGGTVVKLADKLDNLRSFEQGYPKEWTPDMAQGYKRWCKEVIVNLPDHEETDFKDNIKNLKETCLKLCNNDFDLECYYRLITV